MMLDKQRRGQYQLHLWIAPASFPCHQTEAAEDFK
jgi:hypothetical protein